MKVYELHMWQVEERTSSATYVEVRSITYISSCQKFKRHGLHISMLENQTPSPTYLYVVSVRGIAVYMIRELHI